jgi:membrane protein required for colicin V production
MILDILFAIVIVLAVFRGYRRGLIVGIFSLVAIIVGLAAAIKLSLLVSQKLADSTNISREWLPVISFLLVFIVVVLLVRLGANFIQRTVEVATLGWVNRLGGVVLYLVIYVAVFSVLLFYAGQVELIRPSTISKSATYDYISPVGPKAINAFGTMVPVFKNMFIELQEFFSDISHKMR